MSTHVDVKTNDEAPSRGFLKRFSRGRSASNTEAEAASSSSISSDITIDGNVSCRGKAHFDGEVRGNIECNQLIVGKNGHILGDIKAEQVVVFGKVQGTIHCEKIALKSGAEVRGDIFHSGIAIEMGASFLGRSESLTPESASETLDEAKQAPRAEVQSVPVVSSARN